MRKSLVLVNNIGESPVGMRDIYLQQSSVIPYCWIGSYFSDSAEELLGTLVSIHRVAAESGAALRSLVRERAKERFAVRRIADAYEQLLVAVVRAGLGPTTVLAAKWAEGK